MIENPPVRVLNFLTDFNVGGTERHVLNLAANIDSSRFRLDLACLKRRGQFLEVVERNGIPLREYRVESFHDPRTLFAQYRFRRDLVRESFDIVQTYGFYTNAFGIVPARLARRPVVVASIRDTGAHLTRSRALLQRMACRFADRVVVNADAVKRWLVEEGYAADRITVIRNGIAIPRPVPRTGAVHAEYGLPAGAPLVGVIARLNRVKGLAHFLEAAARIARSREDVRFLVIGDGPIRGELQEQARKLGIERRVVFTGLRLDVPSIVPELDLSVLPSLSEGLSNVLLESMAAGVPVVATAVGGTPEIVESGASGLLVPPADPPALATAIERVLCDSELASKLGNNGAARVRSCFSMEVAVRETQKLYADLLAGKREGRVPLVGRYVD